LAGAKSQLPPSSQHPNQTAGAIFGGIAGGGKGAAIGAGVGGTGAVVATRGDEVRLGAGTILRVTLQQPVKVVVNAASD
jgi:hypothetical protein